MTTNRLTGIGVVLRAARREKGWSQAEAARCLAALGAERGVPTASPASLKAQLSRWENGHAAPEQPYRKLLGELYEHDHLALDLPRVGVPPADGEGLRNLLDEAAAVDEPALELLRAQLAVTRELDHRLGAAGTADSVRAQLGQLTRLLDHTIAVPGRRAVAGLLAETALLAGWQALDQDRIDEAWDRHGQARAVAREADVPGLHAEALAGQAAVLLELGRPAAAVELLAGAGPDAGGCVGPRLVASAWVAAALGAARAAGGDIEGARHAFDAAERLAAPPGSRPDLAGPGLDLDYDGVHRWRGAALAPLGDVQEAARLRDLVAAERPVRQRAALEADLAIALAVQGADDAAAHARSARLTAARIGSHRVRARLDSAAGAHRVGNQE